MDLEAGRDSVAIDENLADYYSPRELVEVFGSLGEDGVELRFWDSTLIRFVGVMDLDVVADAIDVF